ncbi:uncharacterized protein LOC120332725 [Styela clava]|uniref:putative mitochondrial import inner membrane translocase subunit Tim8 A-B n=1 Tax=Styela clava TaxID=7725 RepID=UPI00193926CF|nr:putative mitochondrial import inner membrane translocase subunit Tim8 A-B [Styela clava]
MDFDANALQDVTEQLKNNPDLARMLIEEQQKMEAQNQLKVIVNKLTSDCWNICVDRVGNSLGRQETCLTNCAERFLESDQFIRQRMSSQKQ